MYLLVCLYGNADKLWEYDFMVESLFLISGLHDWSDAK